MYIVRYIDRAGDYNEFGRYACSIHAHSTGQAVAADKGNAVVTHPTIRGGTHFVRNNRRSPRVVTIQ